MSEAHQRVVALLPWFVNGTLSAPERELVQDHVNRCLPCRRALLDEQKLCGAVRNTTIPTREQAGLDRLLAAIDSDGRVGAGLRDIPSQRRGWPPAQAVGLAAAAAIAAIFVTLLLPVDPAGPDRDAVGDGRDFRTLSTEPAARAARVDVIFAPGTSAQEIESLLGEIGASSVTGPSALGRYTVLLPASADAEETLARLRADDRVRFAGQTFIEADTQ